MQRAGLPGKQYAIYVDGGPKADLKVDLPAGGYRAEQIDTKSGAVVRTDDVAGGAMRILHSAEYSEGIALKITRK